MVSFVTMTDLATQLKEFYSADKSVWKKWQEEVLQMDWDDDTATGWLRLLWELENGFMTEEEQEDYYGNDCRLSDLRKLAEKYGLPIPDTTPDPDDWGRTANAD